MYKVLIRPLEISDAEISWKWRNDEVIWKFTGSKPQNKITPEIESEWIKKVLSEPSSKRFAITVDDIYVGNVQITKITEIDAEYHIFIGDKNYWGRGVAYSATKQIIRYAKNVLQLESIYLFVNPNHQKAIKLYKKCGFTQVSDLVKMVLDIKTKIVPKVSIFCMVYNHEPFIRDCLEGFLMQKCNFDYEIVLGEDCSTDNSREIILEYAIKFPGKFKLLLHDKNIGAAQNQKIVFENCNGKYIAMCEGDDYWTDSLKLQKQVGFLENNNEYNLVTSNALIHKRNREKVYNDINADFSFNFKKQIKKNCCVTCSTMFRNNQFDGFENEKFENQKIGDIIIWALLLRNNKKGYFINENLATYRIHSGGVYSQNKTKENIINELNVYESFLVSNCFNKSELKSIQFNIQKIWFSLFCNSNWFSKEYSYNKIFKYLNILNYKSNILIAKSIIKYYLFYKL